MLLSEIQFASDQRSRMDTLIRSYAAQDNKTGLNNRLFFDNQLATLLEDQEKVGTHGVVMMIRLPDFDLLRDNWGQRAEENLFTLINLLSTFIMRYPGALLALSPQRFCRAVAAPHAERVGKHRQPAAEGGGCAAAEQNARQGRYGAYGDLRLAQRAIDGTGDGTCGSGYPQRRVAGANGWAVYDDSLPEKGRGNVRWRTLIEQMLSRGGPRIYQKPAVMKNGMFITVN
jgi:RNase E specificity factor CsrD